MTSETPKIVAITGASGYVGSRLLQQLEEKNLGKLVAIDTKPPPFPIHNIAIYRRDVEEPIDDLLRHHRVNTLVHLAFDSQRSSNRAEVCRVRQRNLTALQNTLDSCVRAGVGHVVYVSSHTIYGAHPDNPIPITEHAPLRPSSDFAFGYDKFLSDQIVTDFADHQNNIKVTILRPCAVLGPSAPRDLIRVFMHPRLVDTSGYNPFFQFLHEDDLAQLLTLLVMQAIPGVYNLAGEGVAFYQEVTQMIQSKLPALPPFVATQIVKSTWRLGIQARSNRAEMDLLRYPILLSTVKLEQATGYHPRYTSLETLTAFTNSVLL